MSMPISPFVALIDMGSQYSHLLYQAICKLGYDVRMYDDYRSWECDPILSDAIILSGGPQSIYEDQTDYSILKQAIERDVPVLGICYGMQLLAHLLGGKVEKGDIGEYGNTKVKFSGSSRWLNVWMSHRDHITCLPSGFKETLVTENNICGAFACNEKRIFGFQFHPEVKHTENGLMFLGDTLERMGLGVFMTKDLFWLEEIPADLDHAICAFSGGVDSLVAATYVHNKIGDRLKCLYIDTGLMRIQDEEHIQNLKASLGLNIEIIRAKDTFLSVLKGISEPETKRKAIGKAFIDVFEEELLKLDERYNYLLMGTLYTDRIESGKGNSDVIKSHHNVGGLPANMKLKIYEPLKNFYKSDVRSYGESILAINTKYLNRHPFPGPGLGIRILGEITEARIEKVRKSDYILHNMLQEYDLYDSIWQAFTALITLKSVGVKGDKRVYDEMITIRMVNSIDGMTADASEVDFNFLKKLSNEITNRVEGVTRCLYEISDKPPSTIEYE